MAVHPRARGEHPPPCPHTPGFSGSSPRARGTRFGSHFASSFSRFIPARAGNTPAHRRHQGHDPVHPRARGEHHAMEPAQPITFGSSPRARGTLQTLPRPAPPCRFIPARAGNTQSPRGPRAWSTVHPRARGEHPTIRLPRDGHGGSSPRARGTRHADHETEREARFIPARAGNTERRTSMSPFKPVHPRARGEHINHIGIPGQMGGSSPRARGTHRRDAAHGGQPRFIPARAGNTLPPPL